MLAGMKYHKQVLKHELIGNSFELWNEIFLDQQYPKFVTKNENNKYLKQQ